MSINVAAPAEMTGSWFGDAIDAKRMIELCSVCQRVGPRHFGQPWHALPISQVNEVAYLDFFEQIQRQGRMIYFLVIVDAFSRLGRMTDSITETIV